MVFSWRRSFVRTFYIDRVQRWQSRFGPGRALARLPRDASAGKRAMRASTGRPILAGFGAR